MAFTVCRQRRREKKSKVVVFWRVFPYFFVVLPGFGGVWGVGGCGGSKKMYQEADCWMSKNKVVFSRRTMALQSGDEKTSLLGCPHLSLDLFSIVCIYRALLSSSSNLSFNFPLYMPWASLQEFMSRTLEIGCSILLILRRMMEFLHLTALVMLSAMQNNFFGYAHRRVAQTRSITATDFVIVIY